MSSRCILTEHLTKLYFLIECHHLNRNLNLPSIGMRFDTSLTLLLLTVATASAKPIVDIERRSKFPDLVPSSTVNIATDSTASTQPLDGFTKSVSTAAETTSTAKTSAAAATTQVGTESHRHQHYTKQHKQNRPVYTKPWGPWTENDGAEEHRDEEVERRSLYQTSELDGHHTHLRAASQSSYGPGKPNITIPPAPPCCQVEGEIRPCDSRPEITSVPEEGHEDHERAEDVLNHPYLPKGLWTCAHDTKTLTGTWPTNSCTDNPPRTHVARANHPHGPQATSSSTAAGGQLLLSALFHAANINNAYTHSVSTLSSSSFSKHTASGAYRSTSRITGTVASATSTFHYSPTHYHLASTYSTVSHSPCSTASSSRTHHHLPSTVPNASHGPAPTHRKKLAPKVKCESSRDHMSCTWPYMPHGNERMVEAAEAAALIIKVVGESMDTKAQ